MRLQCFVSSPPRALGNAPVVLLHGWEGSAESLYVLSLAQLLFERGFEVVRLNLRDHGETHHLNRELFHSCRLPEVVGAVAALQRHFAGRPLQLVGFSLGGNFMLRVAAQARAAGLNLARVIAVSPVLEPADDARRRSSAACPATSATSCASGCGACARSRRPGRTLTISARSRGCATCSRMTAELVRCYTEFPTLEDYLNGYAITGERLAQPRGAIAHPHLAR